jgi:indolepyruvate ferredoxin oxidoreductase, beta subunit
MTTLRPITLLIAALGGEGGGVLTNWIVAAAAECGFPVQSTSIPGVAQRTGATTYYIEILPVRWAELGGRRPVLALTPGIGDIDIAIASELMEAGRVITSGFVTSDRTLMIASSSRFYAIGEKIAMGDGRYDQDQLTKAIALNAREHLIFDMEQTAKKAGAMINAVMLGAIAGSGRLPIPTEALEAAISADGKAVDANLRGFRAGLAAAKSGATESRDDQRAKRARMAESTTADLEADIAATMPSPLVVEGIRRLAAYQDLGYARLYIDRLKRVRDLDARVGAEGKLLAETARHLAVRMSFEDVIRVAQAKIDPQRLARIKRDIGAKPGEPVAIVDFLKPGVEEFAQLLPPTLARALLAFAERRGFIGWHRGMEINSASISGFLQFWCLAKLKVWRRGTYRYHEEQQAIENWLELIAAAAERSPALALEIVECARLIKGYGDTFKRGVANFQAIETRVIRPALLGRIPLARAVDAVASARTAALVDPEGESLAKCLSTIEQQSPLPLAAE